ncbi:MAG TPA: YoaK family protein [Chryseolinea sp.]|nr:YoaK family protein [Chryseolinea sp.]HPM31664.1 YoaK family protein [Chryseolinea sp.]
MFRHHGKTRTLSHNKRIASLLSFVAGIVNVVGFLSVQRLTTNVTGHFAFFVDEVFKLNLTESLIYFFYILFFFLGSFVSSLLVEIITIKNERFVFVIPTLIESVILFAVAFFGHILIEDYSNVIAFSLLFAMGLQNSLVTRISNAIVRTTHLTGLFTDLGIDLSQLFFYRQKEEQGKLISTIKLRLRIITFFFLGGLIGGIFYSYSGMYVLFIPATMLIIGLYYDNLKFKLLSWKRNYDL